MRVLQVHNFYQAPGGEDRVCAAEQELLVSRGHSVRQYLADNRAIGGISKIGLGVRTFWNPDTYRNVRALVHQERPDIIHAHNTFPLISPALYYAAAAERVPVIQTLHNYRLLCPGANLFRDGHNCEDCVGSLVPYSAVLHRCYRNSLPASAVTASMLLAHRAAGTWKTKVHTYIALTNFARSKFVDGGLPDQKVVVKSNFLARDPGAGDGGGGYALFVGRICEEKGISTLVRAWEQLGSTIQLKIAGDGPLAGWLKERVSGSPGMEWIGPTHHATVIELLKRGSLLICPSLYHEGGPLTIIEALGCGTPVIASGLDSIKEFVIDGVTGFHFRPGDEHDLAERVRAILARPEQLSAMRRAARLSYEQNYTAERNYGLLIDIYRRAIQQ